MTEVKICGIRDAATMDAVVSAGADWVGFVFFPPSPRAVTPREAGRLAGRHCDGPQPVGLFVEPSDTEIEAALEAVPLAALQVHAGEKRAAAIQARFQIPVWRVMGISGPDDLPHSSVGVSRLLLDRKPGPNATLPGGNAQVFDWTILRNWTAPTPWVLAGGLTPGNVAEAIRETGTATVDVSSGVEQSRGIKDAALIAAFVSAVRSAELKTE